MASPLEAAGATKEPSQFAPLTMDRYITGMATQRSPLRDAGVSYEYAKFYSASRYDSIINGVNAEINAKQNLARRPGASVYNSQNFTPIARMYPFRVQVDGKTQIRVMADCAEAVYDATGPNTKQVIWTKLAGSGRTSFQSVGNTLYFSDGVSLNKWTVPTLSYQHSKNYKPGQTVADPSGNVQVAVGGTTIGIVGVSVAGNVVTLQLDPTSTAIPDNFNALVGINATFSNMTVATYLNGQTLPITSVPTDSSFTVSFVVPDAPLAPETGSFSTGSGTTAASGPSWNITLGGITQDGGQQWINKGSAVTKWGIAVPINAPSVSQQALPQTYPAWSKNTYYSTCYLIYHGANLIEQATGFGNTGSSEPAWNSTTVGDTTADGAVVWTFIGDGTYTPGGTYTAGKVILHADAGGTLYFFKCVTGGTAGASTVFASTLGAPVQDGSAVWQNLGVAQQWSSITSTTVTGGFGVIPVFGGGSVILGMGQGAANGSPIALPTGYTTTNMVAWSTAGTGFSGTSAVTSGVFQSSVAGGVLNSSFQKDTTQAFAFNCSSNWAAAAWSSDATVTLTTVGSFQILTFKTANGDDLAIIVGSLANGSITPVPTGFAIAQFLYCTGMSGTQNVNHVMQGVSYCRLNATTLAAENLYDDNSGNTWSGTQNVFGVFWKTGQGVTTASVTNGSAILIPVAGGNNLALVASLNLAHGSSFGLPTGFSSATAQVTCGAAGFTTSGGNHSHGWDCSTSGLTSNGVYRDGSGNQWNMTENCFAIASVLTTTAVAQPQTVIDKNGFRQTIIKSGTSGTSAPAWNESQGSTTTDNGAIWQNTGSQTLATTAAYQYAFSFKSSTYKGVSTSSPRSLKITFQVGNFGVITGNGSPDPQADTIVIWRTNVGGSDLVERAEIPAPPAGQKWTFKDTGGDETLNNFIVAPENGVNNPPPAGLTALAYHGRRLWGYVGNVVQYATGPDVTAGNGNEAWSPSLAFPLPDAGARLVPVTLQNGGLLCFTASDVYCIFGTGTPSNPYFDRLYAAGIGLLNYDALDVIGSTIHLFTTASKQVSMDPSAGYTETGFPIGDQFKSVTAGTVTGKLYNPATAFVTWLEQQSGDTALYVADGAVGWFRYAPISAPDHGFVWSPRAEIQGGTSAVQAVEIAPGLRALLIGPALNGPILMRDPTINNDNGALYSNCFADIGSIQLAQPGSIAEVAFVTLDSLAVGTAPTCGILFDEIHETADIAFDMLDKTANDPPDLDPSETMFMERFSTMQNGQAILCRHMQLRIQWSQEDAPNELLQHTIYGAKYDERVQA